MQSSHFALVLGMCQALDPTSHWLADVPPSIASIYGFVTKARSSQGAALVAGILIGDGERFQAYAQAIHRVFGAGVTEADLPGARARVEAELTLVDAEIVEDPVREVQPHDVQTVRVLRRAGARWDAVEYTL